MRAALYIRVSSEEQAIHGLSIEAQTEALEKWAEQTHVQVVDRYIDAGISARKKAYHRPALQRLLSDVRSDKIELIVFTKLDRWFRNIAEYYKVQEILEEHHVNWKTIHEDYDTSTASGRLKINIMLSVAQDEADRTSERIKAVFDSKVLRCEPISGKVPVGYRIENKRLVADPETAPVARDIFRQYVATRSINALRKYVLDKYGMAYSPTGLRMLLSNERYIGRAHGQEHFCEGIIDPDTFAITQVAIAERAQRNSSGSSGRVYLFSGIARCAECGTRLAGKLVRGKYIYYRCTKYDKLHLCTHKKYTSELTLEAWLLENMLAQLTEYHTQAGKAIKAHPVIDESAIRRRMEKIRDLYLNDLMEREDYERHYLTLRDMLLKAQNQKTMIPQPVNLDGVRTALSAYKLLPRASQKEFWSRTVKQIIVTNSNDFSITPYSPYNK